MNVPAAKSPLLTPSAAAWRAMTPAAKQSFLNDALAALQQQADLAPEGRPHSTAKMAAAATLGDFFDRIGKQVYLACELPVHYPEQPGFAPDLLAVLDVPDPGNADTRMAWVVEDEGRGIDFVLEITHRGNRRKDLFDNVMEYASLQIPEYFVYDRLQQRLFGYRLPNPDATRYTPIPSRLGKLKSTMLGLDLGIVGGRLRFYYGEAELPEARELVTRLNELMDEAEDRLAAAEAGRAEAEKRAEDEATARVAAEAARAEAEARVAELQALLAAARGNR